MPLTAAGTRGLATAYAIDVSQTQAQDACRSYVRLAPGAVEATVRAGNRRLRRVPYLDTVSRKRHATRHTVAIRAARADRVTGYLACSRWNERGILFVDTSMKTRIQKWGNSLALRIPKPFAEEARLAEDSTVDVTVRNGKLVVVAVEEPEETLESLVALITTENRHGETDTGRPVGNEIW